MKYPDVALLALDPGVTTGVALWAPWVDKMNNLFVNQFDATKFPNAHRTFYDYLSGVTQIGDHHNVPLTIICEAFNYDPGQQHAVLTGIEYIGITKIWAQNHGVPLIMQPRSLMAKDGFWTDARIKRLGLWYPGFPHGRDALKHLLYHRAFTIKERELLQAMRDMQPA